MCRFCLVLLLVGANFQKNMKWFEHQIFPFSLALQCCKHWLFQSVFTVFFSRYFGFAPYDPALYVDEVGTFVLHHCPIFGLFKSDAPEIRSLSFLGNKRNACY